MPHQQTSRSSEPQASPPPPSSALPPPPQVSTAIDPALALPPSGNAGSLQPSATTNGIRPEGQHDFQRVKTNRKPRGGGGSGGTISNADQSAIPPECAACLGLWDGGGSALNRWYRCRRCGGTVHGACRQFFEAGEDCVVVVGEDEGGEEEGVVAARPAGWRDPVNRAGVVQVRGVPLPACVREA